MKKAGFSDPAFLSVNKRQLIMDAHQPHRPSQAQSGLHG